MPLLTNAVRVAVGSDHSCAATDDGGVLCWGLHEDGEVDGRVGSAPEFVTPQRVAGVAGATHVGVGPGFSCARTRDGSVWCWGRNDRYQHGRGIADDDAAPHRTSLEGAVSLVVRSRTDAMSALVEGGEVRCWGRTQEGLGVETNVFRTPERVLLE
ncbi:MAG: hypothetical protein AAF938_22030 [Myxococcota bacterium]